MTQARDKQKRIQRLWLLVLVMLASAVGVALMVSAAYLLPPKNADKGLLRVDVSKLSESGFMTVAINPQRDESLASGYLIVRYDAAYHVFDGWVQLNDEHTQQAPFLPASYRNMDAFCNDFRIHSSPANGAVIQCTSLTQPLRDSQTMRWRLNGQAIDLVTRDLDPVPSKLEDGLLVIGTH